MSKFNYKSKYDGIKSSLGLVVLAITLGVAIQASINWLLMVGWNFLAPTFGLPILSFWHVTIIVILLAAVASIFKGQSNSK